MKVRLKANYAAPNQKAGYAGDVIDLDPDEARRIIAAGYAEPAGPALDDAAVDNGQSKESERQ